MVVRVREKAEVDFWNSFLFCRRSAPLSTQRSSGNRLGLSCIKHSRSLPSAHSFISVPQLRTINSSDKSMSFADIETGLAQAPHAPSSSTPISREDAAFQSLQSSLAMQVFKINANVRGMLELVEKLGTAKDSEQVRTGL